MRVVLPGEIAMTQQVRLGWPLAALLLLPAGAGGGFPAPAPVCPCSPRAIVLAVDGAGGFEASSRALRHTVIEDKLPLEIQSFHWTHGYCRILSDQMHASHMRREGKRLADLVLRCRDEAPDRPIYLVGHSAGCGVLLTAAESLPPCSVERVVLLAPAVSVKHDLRPALVCSCRGMDVFYSQHDWVCLGVGMFLAGTTDRCWTLAAGKVGFRPVAHGPEEEMLFAKLRQYPWDASLSWTGHKGGHYGPYQPGFLRMFVLPLLNPGLETPESESGLK
jgi:pimeloyl-ACP methyl ester carboxylesterase